MARVDYDVGDEIVVVKPLSGFIEGSHYICVDLHERVKRDGSGYCVFCSAELNDDMLVVELNIPSPKRYGCSCWFRKKLDFKKLCNVDETIKEDA